MPARATGTRRPAAATLLAAATTAVLLAPSLSPAANKAWVGPNGGSWNTAANWSPSGVPSSATTDNVTITPTPTADYSVILNTNYPTTALGTVTLNSPNAFRLSLNHTSSAITLRAASEVIATTGNATYNQLAGSNVATTLSLGDSAGGTGTYSLSSTGSVTAPTTYVGNSGTGSFFQTGGTASLGLILGNNAGSTGFYSLSGSGSLSSGNPVVGMSGTGSFSQTDGTYSVTSRLTVGFLPGSSGSYRLSGGTLSASSIDVCFDGAGSLIQTGGTCIVGGMSIGVFGNGSYSLSQTPFSSSTLTASSIAVGGDGTEPGGTGLLSISSGTATITGSLKVWNTPGSLISLTGGSLTVGALDTTSDPSRFSWTGGTLAFSNGYTIDSSFALGLAVTVGPGMTLASSAPAANNALLNLNGGTLDGPASLTNYAFLTGYGTLAQPLTNSAAGNIQLGAGLPLTLASVTIANAGALRLNSGSITGTGTLSNTGLLSGPGAIAVSLTNTGTIALPEGSLQLPSFTNSGLITLDSAAAQLTGGPIANAGTLQGRGRVTANVTNNGSIEPVAGVLQLAGSLANPVGGTLRVPASTKLLVTGSFPTSAGAILLAGGTLDTNGQPLTNTGSIVGNGLLLGGTLTNAGTVLLSGGPSTVTNPVLNNASRTFTVQNSPALFTSPVTNNGTFHIINTTATFAAGFSGTAPSAPGTLTVDSTGSLLANSLSNMAVTDAGTIALRPSSQGGSTSTLTSLTLNGTATFDVADNDLFIDYATTSPLATVRQYLLQSHLISSTANADAQHRLALGYADAATFAGNPSAPSFPDSTSLLVTLTYLGDANLDGKVNGDDFALIDRGRAKGLTGWTNGDFNHDNTINANDYLLIDRVFAQQSGPLSAEFLAMRESQFGADYVTQLLTAVPEPSSLLAMCGLALLPLARRRQSPSGITAQRMA